MGDSQSSAARTGVERAHGCRSPRDLSRRNICRRGRRGAFGICLWSRRFVDLALHPDAGADRLADHCVRPDLAGLCGLEASPCDRLAQALAIRRRRRVRHPDRRVGTDLNQPCLCARGHRRVSRRVQPLWFVSPERARDRRRRAGRRRSRISQRRACGPERALRCSRHDLVPPARLASRPAACGVSAGPPSRPS